MTQVSILFDTETTGQMYAYCIPLDEISEKEWSFWLGWLCRIDVNLTSREPGGESVLPVRYIINVIILQLRTRT